MSCFIFGDCLALGLAAVLGGCGSSAKVGISSAAVISRTPDAYYDLEIVSAGSNDRTNRRRKRERLLANLEAIRSRVHAGRVVWVRPVNTRAGSAVKYVARRHRDAVVEVTPGRDNVHPKSYRVLAGAVLKAGAS